MRVLFRQPHERTRALCTALADADDRVRQLALAALAEGVPDPAVPLLAALATDLDAGDDLRIPAVRALGHKGGPIALDTLLKLTEVRRRSLLDVIAAQGTPPVAVAALAALAAFPKDARARERLELWARGRDPAAARAAADALKGRS
jgi:hypothetical protein